MISATESSRKVLVVDPDTTTRREVRAACEQDGYQVLEADERRRGAARGGALASEPGAARGDAARRLRLRRLPRAAQDGCRRCP